MLPRHEENKKNRLFNSINSPCTKSRTSPYCAHLHGLDKLLLNSTSANMTLGTTEGGNTIRSTTSYKDP